LFRSTNTGVIGKEDLSFNLEEGLGENGNRHRLLGFGCDSCKGFVLWLVYASIEAFRPGEIFGQVSPDVQGFLWVWGSRHIDVWGGRWGGRGSGVSRLAMWLVVGYVGKLLAYFLEFGGDAR
jgi:hypothetical protein